MMSSRVDAAMGSELRRVESVRGGDIRRRDWCCVGRLRSVGRERELGFDDGGKNESLEVGMRRMFEDPFRLAVSVSDEGEVLRVEYSDFAEGCVLSRGM
jgi:hypothetical protein